MARRQGVLARWRTKEARLPFSTGPLQISHEEDPKKLIDEDRGIEKKYDRYSDSHEEKIPVDAKEKDGQCGYQIFHDKRAHITVTEERVHKRIDLLGSMLDMEDGEVKVENRKQENERQGEEERSVIPVNVQICCPVLPSSNILTASTEHVTAKQLRWFSTPVLKNAFIFLGSGILKTIQHIVHVHPKSSVSMGLVLISSDSRGIAIDRVYQALKVLQIESRQRPFLSPVPGRT